MPYSRTCPRHLETSVEKHLGSAARLLEESSRSPEGLAVCAGSSSQLVGLVGLRKNGFVTCCLICFQLVVSWPLSLARFSWTRRCRFSTAQPCGPGHVLPSTPWAGGASPEQRRSRCCEGGKTLSEGVTPGRSSRNTEYAEDVSFASISQI